MKKNFNARLSTELGGPAKWALIIFTLIFVSAADARQPSGDSAADGDSLLIGGLLFLGLKLRSGRREEAELPEPDLQRAAALLDTNKEIT